MIEKVISEFLNDGKRLEIVLYTDSKSMFDAVNTANLVVDRKLRVDIASFCEMNEREEVTLKWINSKNQIADVLIKRGPSKTLLFKVLQECQLP